ncbi:MAG: hypothetical protein CL484_12040 [Acidobacteria bacterium]|nr:hypothetical protein [Acidobacteriota bacterium]|tara:strand:+ start:2310 stop:3215 length:906 start_codon:yes stop_codon:yes gene_type:complete
MRINLEIKEVRKLPAPGPDGLPLYAIIFSTPLTNGSYILMTGPEMDRYVDDGVQKNPVDENAAFLRGLSSELDSSDINIDRNQIKMFSQESVTKLDKEDVVEAKKKSEEIALPSALENLPAPEDSSDSVISQVVKVNNEAGPDPYNPSATQVDEMVKFLIDEHAGASDGQRATIERRKQQTFRIFCGMTVVNLVKVKHLMPKELRASISQVKMRGLGQGNFGEGSNWVPESFAAFINGETPGDAVYRALSSDVTFHQPTLQQESPDAQEAGELSAAMPVKASDLRASFSSWLANIDQNFRL